jgi:hypothetical protein
MAAAILPGLGKAVSLFESLLGGFGGVLAWQKSDCKMANL